MPILWPDMSDNARMTSHQKEQAAKAMQARVGILCGSPGVGKTFCLGEIASAIIAENGQNSIAIACPTGKAAVRMTESLNRCGLNIRARTIHSMLRGGIAGGFEFNERSPLPFSFLLLDESSMIDTDIAAALMVACPKKCHVLWTGDPNQLPPVGHGAPLRDMIAAGLPYGELREIKRNSGGIVEACAAIRDGQRWEPGDNLILAEETTPERQIETMLRAIRQAASEGSNPIWDVQVVVPVNAKSPLSRKALNKLLQQELNRNPATPGCPFKLGDKIVNTKNAFFSVVDADLSDEETTTNDRNEVYVANGELAEVVDVHEKFVVAKLSNPNRIVRIPLGKRSQDGTEDGDGDLRTEDEDKATGTGCSWDLGYALSCHKAQGAEFPICIVMLDEYPGAKMVCSREWLYTAISRARDKCLLIGKKSVADAFCRKIALGKRKTLLKERILLEIGKRELAEL
jgi:exodeoxyribonuclease V alpha subunit